MPPGSVIARVAGKSSCRRRRQRGFRLDLFNSLIQEKINKVTLSDSALQSKVSFVMNNYLITSKGKRAGTQHGRTCQRKNEAGGTR